MRESLSSSALVVVCCRVSRLAVAGECVARREVLARSGRGSRRSDAMRAIQVAAPAM